MSNVKRGNVLRIPVDHIDQQGDGATPRDIVARVYDHDPGPLEGVRHVTEAHTLLVSGVEIPVWVRIVDRTV